MMDVSAKDLQKLLKILRKEGVSHFKSASFELSFDAAALLPKSTYQKRKAKEDDPVSESSLTPEQIVLWSSMGVETEAAQ